VQVQHALDAPVGADDHDRGDLALLEQRKRFGRERVWRDGDGTS
jgi:hypothetical protein